LILAWGLKVVCDKEMLGTGNFLATMLRDVLSPIWFPAVLFIVASLTSFATGTSWGTMAILIPTAIPIAFNLDGGVYGLTTIICLGAVLDGSIFGDHCSPISDTTIMSSIASSCDHIHHVRTQLPYSLTVAGLALVCGYIPAAFGVPSFVGIGISTVVIGVLFYVVGKLSD
jgi:Na+/H+ antiporter NhaC